MNLGVVFGDKLAVYEIMSGIKLRIVTACMLHFIMSILSVGYNVRVQLPIDDLS